MKKKKYKTRSADVYVDNFLNSKMEKSKNVKNELETISFDIVVSFRVLEWVLSSEKIMSKHGSLRHFGSNYQCEQLKSFVSNKLLI